MSTFGVPEGETINRQEENENIRNTPFNASGNPGDRASIIDTLKARFEKRDVQKTAKIRVTTRAGFPLWLEMDLDFTEENQKGMEQNAKVGNRATRRSKDPEETSVERARAWIINEKCVAIYFDDPEEGGEKFLDSDGDPITLHSLEWLESLGTTDPIIGVTELLSFPALLIVWTTYLDELKDVVDGVDFTPEPSGD